MKKVFLISGFFLATITVQAQQQQVYLTHGWNSSLAAQTGHYKEETGVLPAWDFFSTIFLGLPYNNNSDYDFVTGTTTTNRSQFNVGYRFAPKGLRSEISRSSFGLSISSATYDHSKTWYSGRTTRTADRFTTVMADYQIAWLRFEHVEFFSGMALGITSHKMEGFVNESRVLPGIQITPVGVKAFYKHIGAQVECGYGARGHVSAGLVARW